MTDLLIHTSTGDIQIENNDLIIGISNLQHQEHLLITDTGSLIEDESVGIGLESYINSEDIPGMLNRITEEYIKDGIEFEKIQIDEQGNIIPNGNYKS